MMNNDNIPLVSIVIATYNREKMLKEAIDSALNQDYQNLEIIVANNASTDGTDELMKKYIEKYDNIIYIKREKNIGAHANGYGAYKEVSKGKYIFFLCDDDYLISPTFITNAVNVMENNKNIVLVTGYVLMYFEEINKYLTIPYNDDKLISGIDYLINQSTVTMPNKYPEIIALFFLTSRECIENNELFRTFKESGDLAMRFYAPSLGDIYFLHEFVGCYRLHKAIRETSNIDSLYNDYCRAIEFSQDIVKRYTSLYPKYEYFWKDYIPLKIADSFIRDRIFKTFGLSHYTKEKVKKLKEFFKKYNIKNLHYKIYKYLYVVLVPSKIRFTLSPFIFEYVCRSYIYCAILRIGFYKIDSALFGFIKDKNWLRIWILFFNLKIKIKNKYHSEIPKLYAYANKDILKNSKIEVYYTLDKSKEDQISSYDNIMELIPNSNISKGEPITKTNTTKIKKIKDKKY